MGQLTVSQLVPWETWKLDEEPGRGLNRAQLAPRPVWPPECRALPDKVLGESRAGRREAFSQQNPVKGWWLWLE